MKANVGGMDKILRIVAGVGLFSLFFLLEGNARFWGFAGLVPLLTGVTNFCPLYTVLGINTCPVKNAKSG